eukprot:TRINITY_DN751_c0_g1_i20.p1 TRINITY_DN751_c0_g1~~TRINITY_DN751_c0_g1_i20.p1  ORF type:complete len:364 (-),score=62.00 TRINITY_DN751_c0_g1_i20:504-1526(-)
MSQPTSLLVASSEPISLLVASSRGNLSAVKQLVENDHSLINQTNSIDSCTALHRSASNGHFYTVKYLVQKGIDVNKKNKVGRTALHWAAQYGHKDIVQYLTNHGADVNAQCNMGKTALDLAIFWKKTDCAEILQVEMNNNNLKERDIDNYAMKVEIKTLKKQLAESKTNLIESKAKLVESKAKLAESKAKLTESQAKSQQLSTTNEMLEEQLGQCRIELQQKRMEVGLHKFEAQEYKRQSEEYKREVEEYRVQLDAVLEQQERESADGCDKESLEELVTCPVCFELPETLPVPCCRKGHIICAGCRRKVTCCPMCRSPLDDNVSQIAGDLIDRIKQSSRS